MCSIMDLYKMRIILTIVSTYLFMSTRCYANDASVNTTHGLVKGVSTYESGTKVNKYLGIPYAMPPVDDLRFKDPVPRKTWKNTWNATKFTPFCAMAGLEISEEMKMSEDCLYLNVFVPEARIRFGHYAKMMKAKRPNKTKADPILFEEYVRWITGQRPDNEHWTPFSGMCSLCNIDYDFVGKFETLPEDISYVLRKIYHKEEDYWFPTMNNARSAAYLTEKYYSQIHSTLIYKVRDKFKSDFTLMNYTIDDYLSISLKKGNSSVDHISSRKGN